MNLPQIDYYSCYYYNCLGNQMMAHLLILYMIGLLGTLNIECQY